MCGNDQEWPWPLYIEAATAVSLMSRKSHPVHHFHNVLSLTAQPGSQHRDKAEPAGAMINGTWVPSKGHMTLTGTPRGPYCRDLN